MQTLFDYQANIIDVLLPQAMKLGHKDICWVLPCGGGKTSVFAEMARRAAGKGRRVCITAHRRRLVKQICQRLKQFGVRYTVEMADLPEEDWVEIDHGADVIVGSMQTMVSRLGTTVYRNIDVFIPDECHTIIQDDYKKLRNAIGARWTLGCTATPCHPDGSGFGPAEFSTLVEGCRIEDLIGRNPPRLMPVEVWAPLEVGKRRKLGLDGGVSGDPVAQWIKHAEGLRTLTFCRTIEQCRAVRDLYTSEGISAVHINAQTPDDERDKALSDLEAGEVLVVVCTPSLLGVGTDVPRVECLQSLVKGGSVTEQWQGLGRIQRVAEGKTRAVFLDHSAAVFWHGMPNVSPEWKLGEHDSVQMRNARDRNENPNVKPNVCKSCGMVSAGSSKCPNCTALLFTPKATPPEIGREQLAKVEDPCGWEEPKAPPADPRHVAIWRECLYIAAGKRLRVSAASAMFKNKVGVFPDKANVEPLPEQADRWRYVADVFPDFTKQGRKVRI